MDIFISASANEVVDLFKELGFSIYPHKTYTAALKRTSLGRYHVGIFSQEDKTYCDFHFDYLLHFLFFGVDYSTRSKRFFNKNLLPIINNHNWDTTIHKVNWFTRDNSAIFRGGYT